MNLNVGSILFYKADHAVQSITVCGDQLKQPRLELEGEGRTCTLCTPWTCPEHLGHLTAERDQCGLVLFFTTTLSQLKLDMICNTRSRSPKCLKEFSNALKYSHMHHVG